MYGFVILYAVFAYLKWFTDQIYSLESAVEIKKSVPINIKNQVHRKKKLYRGILYVSEKLC